jgi:hypothetical protein
MLIPTDTKDNKNAANLKPGKLTAVITQSTNSFKPAISVSQCDAHPSIDPKHSLNDSGFFGCSEADDVDESLSFFSMDNDGKSALSDVC